MSRPRYRYSLARQDAKIAGVCSALGDRMGIDPSFVRIGFVAAAFFIPNTSPKDAMKAIFRDARHHRSPNAGWPEAAMAGALGIALAGPRSYGGQMIEARFMGAGGRTELTHEDIVRALKLARVADGLLISLFGVLAWIIWQV